MNLNFIIYDPSDGFILQVGQTDPQGALYMQAENPYMLIGATGHWDTHYVKNGALIERPTATFDKTTIAADGEDYATLILPEPFAATINGAVYDVPDGVLKVGHTEPGSIRVQIDHWPWRKVDVVLEAVDG